VAYEVDDFDRLGARLAAAGIVVKVTEEVPGYRRCELATIADTLNYCETRNVMPSSDSQPFLQLLCASTLPLDPT